MNEEPQTSFWEKLRHVLRPHLLVAVLVAFLVGMGVSPLLTDTQGKVEAAYSSGVEEGQSTAEASYQSQLAEQEEEFSSQLSQQESDWESQAQEEYNNGYSAGYDEGYKEGYAQGQERSAGRNLPPGRGNRRLRRGAILRAGFPKRRGLPGFLLHRGEFFGLRNRAPGRHGVLDAQREVLPHLRELPNFEPIENHPKRNNRCGHLYRSRGPL